MLCVTVRADGLHHRVCRHHDVVCVNVLRRAVMLLKPLTSEATPRAANLYGTNSRTASLVTARALDRLVDSAVPRSTPIRAVLCCAVLPMSEPHTAKHIAAGTDPWEIRTARVLLSTAATPFTYSANGRHKSIQICRQPLDTRRALAANGVQIASMALRCGSPPNCASGSYPTATEGRVI